MSATKKTPDKSDFASKTAHVQDILKQFYHPDDLPTPTSSVFSKTDLRDYLENPERYAKNLRNLSRYLKTRSQVYRKLINDNAAMIDTNFRQVIPEFSLSKKVNEKSILTAYETTCKTLALMNLPSEMLKAYIECWTVDAFFGCYYYFDNEGGVMLPLDPDYCQITGIYPTGDFMFSFDCSYFRQRQEELELWGEPFTTMYADYERDTTNGKWQPMPDEYACCMKVNLENYLYAIPPYLTLFDSIINLEDLKEITAIADEQQIYKLLVFYMDVLTNTQTVDDFTIDPKTAIEYYDEAVKVLPDYTGAILSPMKVNEVAFNDDAASDVNKVENSSKNILKTAGHGVLADPSGTTAVLASLRCDEDYAISSLLPQTESWVNRFLQQKLGKKACRVKFLEVTKYTKDAYKESLIKDMNYGLPMITTLGCLNGFSELDVINMARMNQTLGLEELFKPLATAATRSAEETQNGRPKDDIPTDEGEASADNKEKRG